MMKKIFTFLIFILSLGIGGEAQIGEARPLRIGGLEVKTPIDRAPPETVDSKLSHLEKEFKELRTLVDRDLKTKHSQKDKKPISAFVDHVTAWVKSVISYLARSFSFVDDLPKIFQWVRNAITTDHNYYEIGVFLNKFIISFSSCLVFFFFFLQLLRWMTPHPEKHKIKMLVRFLGYIIGYAVLPYFVYLALSFLEPREEVLQLGLLCAMGIVSIWSLIHLSRLILEPYRPNRRLFQWPDHYCIVIHRLIRRFSFIGIGGFFLAQALLMNGIPLNLYNALLDSIAFVIVVSVIIWIVRHQASYSQLFLKMLRRKNVEVTFLRQAVCNLWHVPLILIIMSGYFEFCAGTGHAQFFIMGLGLSTIVILILAYLEDKISYIRKALLIRFMEKYYPTGLPSIQEYGTQIDSLMSLVFYGIAAISMLEIWGVGIVAWLSSDNVHMIIHRTVVISVIIGVVLSVLKLGNFLFNHYIHAVAEKKDHGGARIITVIEIIRNTLRIGLWIPAILLILSELGFDITPLVASLGIVSFGLSLGAQNLVKDVITGLFMIIEDTISVGDMVMIETVTGRVEAWTIRSLSIRDDDTGALHTIPFSSITRISNLTRNFSYAVFFITFPYRQDVNKVIDTLHQSFAELMEDKKVRPLIIGPLEVRGVDNFNEIGVTIKSRIKTLPSEHNTVRRAFNQVVKKYFDQNQIDFATANTLCTSITR
jgi:small conductance mechanosensitive channel